MKAKLKPYQSEAVDKIVAKINRELIGKGEIDAAQVGMVLIGKPENFSHPINDRIAAAIREEGL